MSFNPETGAEVTDPETGAEATDPETQTEATDQETGAEVTDPETQTKVNDFKAKKDAKMLYDIYGGKEFEEAGYLHTKTEEFKLTKDELPIKGKEYAFIEKGNEGVDGKTESHYGNQIAYELLKLGYTVLFKKIDAVSDLTGDDF